jgi:NAD(P)H-flavin reductase
VTDGPIRLLRLEAPAGFTFTAGQYLEVVHAAGRIPLSLASAPWRLPQVHLHYRSIPGVAEAQWMDELLDSGQDLEIAGPSGNVKLVPPLTAPFLIISGGTGGAQAFSLIDTLSRAPTDWPVGLFWCADDESSLYLREELMAMELPWLHCEFVVDASRTPENQAMARLRALAPEFLPLLPKAACRTPNTPAPQIVLAGSPGFVYAVTDLLTNADIRPAQLRSDVYDYAPRT